MANKHSEKYKSLRVAYSRPSKDHWRPERYGNKRSAKGNESGKADRCRRKVAWFVGSDGRKYGDESTARGPFMRAMRAAGYRHVGNGTWIGPTGAAIVAAG